MNIPQRAPRRSPSWSARLLAAAGLAAAATSAVADEDWRKLLHRQPPFSGPIVRAGDGLRGGGGGDLRGLFPSSGILLQSWIPLNQFPNGASQTSAADCWGYVSPSGREYAIIGLRTGTAFVEVTDPTDPAIVGYISGPDSLWHDCTVIGDHAYLVSEGGRGIQVADMSQIDTGVVTHLGDRLQAGHTSTHTIVSNPDSGFLYLCGTNINNGGLTAVSTADPANPTIVGAWNTRYVHEAQIVTYTEGPYAGREIAFCFTGGPAVGYSAGGGFDIVDVTDKNNMFTIAEARYPAVRFCHQGWVSEDKQYIYINDELDEPSTQPTTTTVIYNIADLTNPVFEGTFTNGSTAVDHNLYVKDGLIYAGNYRSGLRVYRSTDPTNLEEVAYIDTYPANDAPNFNGVWGNYPFLPSGNILISDLEKGLLVVRLDSSAVSFTVEGSLPETVQPQRPTPVLARTTVLGEPFAPASAQIVARVNGGPFEARPMVHLGDGLFRGTLPPAPCFATVEYYFAAENGGNTYTYPVAAPDTLLSAEVASGEDVIFADAMEIDTGWTVGDPSSPDTAVSGIWNRMDPQPTLAQPGDDHSPAPGVLCWITDGRAGTGDGTFDVDTGKTTVISPVIDLAGQEHARIGYWRWYSNTAGAAPSADTFDVGISGDGGSTWSVVEVVGPGGPGNSGGWVHHEFRVADIIEPSATMQLRFVASDLGDGSLVEAAVDDLLVRVPTCEVGCLSDFNDDGVVNSGDISSFLTGWLADITAGTFGADFDGLNGVNSGDISAFLTAWLSDITNGC